MEGALMEQDVKRAVDKAQIDAIATVSIENAKTLFIYRTALLAVGFSAEDTLELLCHLQDSWWRKPIRSLPNPQEQ